VSRFRNSLHSCRESFNCELRNPDTTAGVNILVTSSAGPNPPAAWSIPHFHFDRRRLSAAAANGFGSKRHRRDPDDIRQKEKYRHDCLSFFVRSTEETFERDAPFLTLTGLCPTRQRHFRPAANGQPTVKKVFVPFLPVVINEGVMRDLGGKPSLRSNLGRGSNRLFPKKRWVAPQIILSQGNSEAGKLLHPADITITLGPHTRTLHGPAS
jgi:hypothetical protein